MTRCISHSISIINDDDDDDDDNNAVDTGTAKTSITASKSTRRNSKGSILERTKRMELATDKLQKDEEETEKKKRQKLQVEIELCEIDKKVKVEVKAGARFLALLGQYNELKKTFTNEKIISMFL
jgi:hypothetical protein